MLTLSVPNSFPNNSQMATNIEVSPEPIGGVFPLIKDVKSQIYYTILFLPAALSTKINIHNLKYKIKFAFDW